MNSIIVAESRSLQGRFQEWVASFDREPVDRLLLVTMLLLLFHGGVAWQIGVPVRILGVLTILTPSLLRSPLVWTILFASEAVGNAISWYSIDNHRYLIIYWTAVCVLAVSSTDPNEVFRLNAKFLLALGFTLAVVWKVITPEFLDGRFFEFVLVSDSRIEGVTAAFCGVSRAEIGDNRLALDFASLAPSDHLSVAIHASDATRWLGKALAIWTLFIESSIAIAFLWRSSPRILHIRNSLLLLFIATTYPIIPVAGFAFLLCVLAMATSIGNRFWSRVFLGTIVLLGALDLPWQSLLG